MFDFKNNEIFLRMKNNLTMRIFLTWLTLMTSKSSSLSLEDFYDYSRATELGDLKHLDFDIKFPHWSDFDNMQLDIIKNGIIRFSGLNSANTLDLLVMATSWPFQKSNTIKYESVKSSPELNSNISRDIGMSFNSTQVVIVSWLKAEFYNNRLSTFQIVIASNGTDTYAILKLVELVQPGFGLNFFPEVDLRYSYNGGSLSIRSGFLERTTTTSTAKEKTVTAATTWSNIDKTKPGLWVLHLNKDPNVYSEVSSTAEPVTIAPNRGLPVSDYGGFGLRGEFTFENLTINNTVLLSDTNNDINVVLAKSTADPRYNLMDSLVKEWITDVYTKELNLTNANVNIVSYREGSLVVDYFVSIKDPNCNDVIVCVNETKNKVKLFTQGKFIENGGLTGSSLNKNPIFKTGLCQGDTGACDKNADCTEYSQRFSFGCSCKSGYYGSGFKGNCKKVIDSGLSFTPQLIFFGLFSGFLAEVCLIFVILRILRKNYTNEHVYVRHRGR